jgi:hypothetical protein
MKEFRKYIFLIILALLFSCEDSKNYTDCESCESEEPDMAVITAELDDSNTGGTIIKVYEGRIEDNIVYDSIRVYHTTKYEKRVSLNRMYTITATYFINNKLYTVVNSTTPRVKYTETMCEEPCYYVYDKQVDLTRKYVK